MKKSAFTVVVSLVASLWALSATAEPISVSYSGFAHGYQAGNIAGVRSASVAAGQFQFNVGNGGGVYWDPTLQAFCIDVTTNLVTSGSVQYDFIAASSSARLSAQKLSLISSLYDQRAASLTNSTNSAAFQLALWEIVYDPATLNILSGGSFWASSTFGSSRSLASTWLSTLDRSGNYTSSSYNFYVMESMGRANQALLVARPSSVPEPSTLALLGVGLLACGLARRRRAS